MHLWIGVYLPHLPLEVFRPTWSIEPHAGLVVLEHERVLAMSVAARAAGIRPGMRRGSVLSLLPAASIRDRQTALENTALHGLAVALMQYSPQVTLAPEATILMDVSASLRLFGGIRALRGRIRMTIRTCGLTARLSLAPTGTGAGMLAHAGAGHALRLHARDRRPSHAQGRAQGHGQGHGQRSLDTLLSGLPLFLLPAARPFADWFAGLGCETLGDLRRLPRAGLQRRCGDTVLERLDQALGAAAEIFEWLSLPENFDIRHELPERIEHSEAVLACVSAQVAQLTGWLVARQMAVTRILLRLEHERGRDALPPTEIPVALAEPSWQDSHLLLLLAQRLTRVELAAAVIAVRLTAAGVAPARPLSADLFPEPGGSASDHRRLIELLSARLGADNILQCAWQPDHRPEIANCWLPATLLPSPTPRESGRSRAASSHAASSHAASSHTTSSHAASPNAASPNAAPPPSTPPRPVWLLERPLALLTRQHRPFYGSPLRIVSPGERIEAGWWDATQASVTRDYFVAEAQDRSCYWIFRERLGTPSSASSQTSSTAPSATDAGAQPRWYLHGFFG
ncbi:MAG: Y-family DNA polymerase [Janthinobacterium lividum]